MSLIGCVKTTSDYYYASLEGVSGAEVHSRGKVQLENLEGNSEIPTSYVLNRERYILRFLIGDASYYPHFKISVKGRDGNTFYLKPRRDMKVVSDEGVICASYYPDSRDPSVLHFGWSSGCLSEEIPKQISFDVIDEKGKIIAEEDLPFVLKKDGKYTLLDAI
ncbi:MAG: hypothetical protein WEA82_05090 [Idiomarina sp.]